MPCKKTELQTIDYAAVGIDSVYDGVAATADSLKERSAPLMRLPIIKQASLRRPYSDHLIYPNDISKAKNT